MAGALVEEEGCAEEEQEGDFVELGGVARDAVAEVDFPRKARWENTVGVIRESGEEAADAADGDAEDESRQVSPVR